MFSGAPGLPPKSMLPPEALDAENLLPAPAPIVVPARDPLVDRARSVYLYVVALVVITNYVVLPIVEAWIGRHVDAISMPALGIVVAPAVVYMFGKSWEQAAKARRAAP